MSLHMPHISGRTLAITAGVVGVAATLAACTKDPNKEVNNLFGSFDDDKNLKWTSNEIVRTTQTARGSEELNVVVTSRYPEDHVDRYGGGTIRRGYREHYRYDGGHRQTTSDMRRAFDAAKGSEAFAGVDQLKALMMQYDQKERGGNANAKLDGKELDAFRRDFAPQTDTKYFVDTPGLTGDRWVQTSVEYPPSRSGGSGHYPTGGGDGGGSGNLPTGGGDGGGYTPRPTPRPTYDPPSTPHKTGGSNPSRGNPNNPSDDDF